jgi:hypothetical protein
MSVVAIPAKTHFRFFDDTQSVLLQELDSAPDGSQSSQVGLSKLLGMVFKTDATKPAEHLNPAT